MRCVQGERSRGEQSSLFDILKLIYIQNNRKIGRCSIILSMEVIQLEVRIPTVYNFYRRERIEKSQGEPR